ncbi:hypothetical protein DPMN_059493 [Dreissena polymorpha]|uniref:Uncharacterized protein n=1 Tax=Dreissena polymorpha TaxID=45954 RepID=A0A9D4HGN3_DREPO|nr:hypothetical protein DPMN_059493 [Dreissena polymorpha]
MASAMRSLSGDNAGHFMTGYVIGDRSDRTGSKDVDQPQRNEPTTDVDYPVTSMDDGEMGKTWNTKLSHRRSSSDHGAFAYYRSVPVDVDHGATTVRRSMSHSDVEHGAIASSIVFIPWCVLLHRSVPVDVDHEATTVRGFMSHSEHQLPGTDPVTERNIRHGFSVPKKNLLTSVFV